MLGDTMLPRFLHRYEQDGESDRAKTQPFLSPAKTTVYAASIVVSGFPNAELLFLNMPSWGLVDPCLGHKLPSFSAAVPSCWLARPAFSQC